MSCRVLAPHFYNIPVTTSGVYVSTRGGSQPITLALPPEAKVLAWSLSTRPTDSSGGVYVSDQETGPTTSSEMAALEALGRAVRMDVGEAIDSPANLPGPFELSFALTAVSGIAQVRIVAWVIS